MNLSGLLDLLKRLPSFMALLDSPPREPQSLAHGAHPFVAAGLHAHKSTPTVLLTARDEMAHQLANQIEAWLPPVDEGGPPVYNFSAPDALPYERISWSSETRQSRLTVLSALQSRSENRKPPVVVTSARALMQMTLPPKDLRMALRPLTVGGVVRLEQMTQNWVQTGYFPVDVVEEPGTFARRGGIIDIWPPNLPYPVRIDLFGDEVDSLRTFEPSSQRSDRRLKKIEIGPGSEALSKYGPAAMGRLGLAGESLNAPENITSDDSASPLHDPRLILSIREELRLEVNYLSMSESFRGIEWYLPYMYDSPASLLDYLPDDATLLIDDGAALVETLTELAHQATELQAELERGGELPSGFKSSFFATNDLKQAIEGRSPIILGLGDLNGQTTSANTELARCFTPGPRFGGKTKQFVGEIQKLRTAGQITMLITRQAARLQELLADVELTVHVSADMTHTPTSSSVSLVQGAVSEGFIIRGLQMNAPTTDHRRTDSPATDYRLPTTDSPTTDSPTTDYRPPTTDHQSTGLISLHLFTDTELFGWSKPRARRKSKSRSSVAPEVFFADVKAGDYVVHLEHGIGKYEGLVKMELSGVEREYLQVTYAKDDKLYVPVHQADRLSRYVGAGDAGIPPVTRLGTADWQTVKERAKRAVADIAEDLLKLYAERELVRGYAYSPDSTWQEDLEASFPYQETLDQLTAIEDVKGDMESDRPMDRLICGDVGYGKTEVAVRAAFKAITDGRQVAVLVPTTVLAQQHYRTFSERLRTFPVQVEMLSRFRTQAQQRRIGQGLEEGTIDLVVGTHRLLNQDLKFKDLGLMIIDEEQRFGVAQKERLKQLRTTVDVLTLSATPIPRTLHMSLSGVRDMSTINTPPKARQPVHTVLAEYDEMMVRQAIQRELAKNGQVFFVHNRVRGIDMLAGRIQRLAPEATVIVGHGQMPERELEEAMLMFAEGEADVLVCTTIIENGLDIPNANTIIINRADRFGLAQLYQLRGRVGRSTERGHCYLFYEKNTTLSFDARRRLSAILESSEELGAGFRIAMRDLEIRGAGDLLGARQHGHIDTVGFDLYTRLLAQAINDAKQKKERFDKMMAETGEDESAPSEAGAVAVEGQGQKDLAEKEPAEKATNAEKPLDLSSAPNSKAQEIQEQNEKEAADYLSDTPFDINDPLAPPVTLDLPLDAKIPEYYVEDEGLRLQMYRRIAGLTAPEAVHEMRRELVDRFGVHEETKSIPEEVDNLLFQIHVKILSLRAGVQNIGRELDQIVVRSETLENMNRTALERRLRLALGHMEDEDFVPEEAARVARRAIYLPVDEQGRWRTALIRTLQIMAYS